MVVAASTLQCRCRVVLTRDVSAWRWTAAIVGAIAVLPVHYYECPEPPTASTVSVFTSLPFHLPNSCPIVTACFIFVPLLQSCTKSCQPHPPPPPSSTDLPLPPVHPLYETSHAPPPPPTAATLLYIVQYITVALRFSLLQPHIRAALCSTYRTAQHCGTR